MNTTDTGAPVRLADLMSGGDMRERVAAKAMKRAVVRHLDAAMRAQGMTQAELARRMGTSAAAVHRLLDRDETGLTLATLARASTLLGVRWRRRWSLSRSMFQRWHMHTKRPHAAGCAPLRPRD